MCLCRFRSLQDVLAHFCDVDKLFQIYDRKLLIEFTQHIGVPFFIGLVSVMYVSVDGNAIGIPNETKLNLLGTPAVSAVAFGDMQYIAWAIIGTIQRHACRIPVRSSHGNILSLVGLQKKRGD